MPTTLRFEEAVPVLYTLSNGIRVIHRPCNGQVSCCGYVVDAGSRHELSNESGLAHFTEHMLFKGTAHRKPHHILNRMESVGGELNAYTTKEETFVYSLFLEKDYVRALELLTDLFFNSTFKEEEIEKERLVILDEINSYEDNPSELIYDEFEDMLFEHHPIGRKILGSPESLSTFNQQSFIDFHKRHYRTENIVFFTQSPLPFKKMKGLIERIVGMVQPAAGSSEHFKSVPSPLLGLKKTIDKSTHQAHVLLGTKNFDFNDRKRVGMYLLNNILGGPGMNSRLNLELRERAGLVYSVESNVTSYSDTGVFSVYFGTDPNKIERCLKLVDKELRRMRDFPLTGLQLHSAQQQLFGQMVISSEHKENTALAMGKSMLHFNRFDSLEQVVQKIVSFSALELQDIANEIFDPKMMNLLIYR